jgi:uncharacterized repeat protein (TIGR01451 family)
MNRFALSLKRFAQRFLPVLAIGAAVAVGAASATANGPQFNNLANDRKTLSIIDPALQAAGNPNPFVQTYNAQVGNTVQMMIWAHNTQEGTTAINTRAKLALPTTAGTSLVSTGTVSANNASSVSATTTVVTTQEASLAYVPNSARLMAYNSSSNRYEVVNWPTGINGNDVVGANGVSLGNIDGCWSYAKAILVQVRVEGTTPNIVTNKRVAVGNGSLEQIDVTANPADAVRYRIFVQNDGTGTARNLKVTDVLDARHTYIPGSSELRIKQNGNDVDVPIADSAIQFTNQANGAVQLTYSLNDMAPRPDAAVYLYFKARLKDASAFNIGLNTIPNTATVTSTAPSATTNQTTIAVTRNADPVVSFTLTKAAANLGDAEWKELVPLTTSPGSTIAFRLVLTNTGNTDAQNVTLRDIMPAGLDFVPGTVKLINSANPNGVSINDSVVAGGYVFATVRPGTGNQQIVTFQARVPDACSATITRVNTGVVTWNGAERARDTADVIVSCTNGLNLQKLVLDPNDNVFKQTAGDVRAGQVITYRIIVSNSGNTTLQNPIVRDVLPQWVTYLPNTLRVDNETQVQSGQNAFFGNGLVLTNLTKGMGKVIEFQVKVIECPYDSVTVTNTAFARADAVAQISSSASFYIRAGAPTFGF